jgi:RecA-family ATPase
MEENKKMTDLPFQIEGSLKKLFIGADEIKNKDYDSIEFLVDKLIPQGTLCALVGESDTGKSSLLRQLALSLVYGDSDFLGFKLKESCRNVIYVSTEDGEMATSVWLNKYLVKRSQRMIDYQNSSMFTTLRALLKT